MRSIELPANAIVIFIIAITVLLGVVYFFFSAYQNTSPSLISTANQTGSQLEQTQTKMKCMLLTIDEIKQKCDSACGSAGWTKYEVLYNEGKIKCYCRGTTTPAEVEC